MWNMHRFQYQYKALMSERTERGEMANWESLHNFPAMDMAEELALRDAEMLRRITPEEICNGAWMHDTKASDRVTVCTVVPSSVVV